MRPYLFIFVALMTVYVPHVMSLTTKAYVTNHGINTVSIIDTADGNSVTAVTVGTDPYFITFNGAKAYVRIL